MRLIYLPLVATMIACGLGAGAKAAIVNKQNPVVFSFDLPETYEEYLHITTGGISISCEIENCVSPWDWMYLTFDGEWISPADPLWDSDNINWEVERMRYSHPPEIILALLGTEPGLGDIGSASAGGMDYGYDKYLNLSSYNYPEYFLIPVNLSTMYITFLVDGFGVDAAYYSIDKTSAYFMWVDGDGYWMDSATVEGRLHSPYTPVPVPGSLLFILSSIGVSMVPGIRKRLAL